MERRFIYADLFRYLHIPKIRDLHKEDYGIFDQTTKTNLFSQIITLLKRFADNKEDLIEIEDNDDNVEIILEENQQLVEPETELSLKEKLQKKIREQQTPVQNPNLHLLKKSKKDLLKVIRSEIKYYDNEGLRGKYLEIVYSCLMTVRPTSVDSERAFSSAGALVTKIRSLLADESIDTLCFLRAYFNKIKKSN